MANDARFGFQPTSRFEQLGKRESESNMNTAVTGEEM